MADNQWLPAKQQTELDKLRAKQKIAKSLLEGVQAPQAQMVGGRYISPGLGGAFMPLLKAMVGGNMGSKQAEELGALQESFGSAGALGSPQALMKNRNVEVTDPKKYAETGDPNLVKQRPQFDPRSGMVGTEEFRELRDGTKVQKWVARDGTESWKPVSKGTTINMPGAEKTFQSALGKDQAELLKTGYDSANKAMNVINGVQSAREIIKQTGGDLVTGAFAKPEMTLRSVASKFFGIGDAMEVANTQELYAQMLENVPAIIKEVGGTQLSDADREAAEKLVGADPSLQLEAIINIMNRLEADALNSIDKYQSEFGKVSQSYPEVPEIDVYNLPPFEYDRSGMGKDIFGRMTPKRYRKPPDAPPPNAKKKLSDFTLEDFDKAIELLDQRIP